MAYAILRFAKRKGGAAKAIAAHNERTKEAYASNPDIDKSRTVQNYHLIVPRWSYGQEIRHRISMASCRVRRDSVKFVETLITTSPEFAKAHEAEMPEYFERALGFLKERVGEENIFSAVVHMDEKTPHLHLCFVPLTKDNRLSAKEILGNKKRMIQWQDDFYACMSERWPELERGAPAVETKRKHLTPQWYKKVTAMDAKLERLETALNDINVFNARQEARGGDCAAGAALAGGRVLSGGNSADAGSCVTIAFHAAMQRRGKRRAERRADRRAPEKCRAARKARRAGRALQTGGKAAE